jgi:2-octaprenyl-6-methoxyphenol hydroxylase
VRVYQHSNPHHGQAYEKFLETGPFAILPLPENRSSIVWAVPSDQAQTLRSLADSEFDQTAFQHMQEYADLTPYSPVWERPLNGLWVPFFTTHRLALIGDAAHQIHPLAGQGFNLGIHDIMALEETLEEGVSLGLDIGSQTLLKRYEQKQRWHHLAFLGATHGLNRLFSNDEIGLKWLRTRGLEFVEKTPSLKRFFAHKGAGLPSKATQPPFL